MAQMNSGRHFGFQDGRRRIASRQFFDNNLSRFKTDTVMI
jgi:hypothetical protein